MKEIILKTLKDTYLASPLSDIIRILPDAVAHLVLAAKLWTINLSLYLSIIVSAIFLSILTSRVDFLEHILDFTRAYFYDGTFLDLVAWRIHLSIYLICLLLTFND